uniref:Uncharacterized protein n=1 Tax=Tanacetum cinerariifolium TaxID=118510 RepID=A0A6L2LXW0_TANCI|nr:hypothetical protein [Tanacetum cinerariifolium]
MGGADAQTRFETESKKSRDPPLSEVNTSRSREDRMEHPYDLMDFVSPTPYDSPLSGGHTPESDEEKKRKERTSQHMKRRLFKGRVETSTNKSLGKDASKLERYDDKTEELNLTDEADIEVIVEDKGSGEKGGSTAEQVSTVRPEVSAASVLVNVSAAIPYTPPTTTTIFGDEDLTIAQNLIKLRSEKAKVKGVTFRDVEEPPRLTRSTTTLQPLLTIDPKDKGKGVMVEEEPEKIEKEKQKQEEATIAVLTEEFDEIQAKIDADYELAIRMTHEEQEKYTIEEMARLLAEYFKRRKKQLAAERAEILSTKYPIVDWESQNLGNVDMEDLHVYKIIKANRNISYHKSLSSMLRKFDRQDFMDLHRLVMKRFKNNTPEGYNLLLWGDLKVMFEPNAEDEIWSNQQDWNLISWKLYENCGVHTLLMDEAEAESTMAFELLKFIKSHVEERRDVWIHPPSDQDVDNEET